MVSWGSQIIDPARPRGSSLVGRFTAWCHHLQVDRLWFCPGGDRHGWVLGTHRFLRAFLFLRRKESRRAKLLWPYIDNIIYNVYTYLHTYIHTDRQTDRHTYIHAYTHTRIHAYTHTHSLKGQSMRTGLNGASLVGRAIDTFFWMNLSCGLNLFQ